MRIFNSLLSGVLLPLLLGFAALYFLIRFKGLPLRKFFHLLSLLGNKESEGVSPVKAVSLALAGTLGVGNIVGIAAAVIEAGPGVLFWMFLSSFAAMTVKYAEIVLSMERRNWKNGRFYGGAMYYMKKPLAFCFASLCIFCSFTVGSPMQSAAAANALSLAFPVPSVVFSFLVGVLTLLSIVKEKKALFDLSVKLVPLMSFLYLLLSLTVIFKNIEKFPSVLRLVISDALGIKEGVYGGILGLLPTLRYGVVRGLLSNEAGCGTAPLAHAASSAKCAPAQGALGVLEVAVDTLLFCMLTGFTLLLSGVPLKGDALKTVFSAFYTVFGKGGTVLLSVSIFFFAFATLVCWAYYGTETLFFFTENKQIHLFYKMVFSLLAVFGVFIPMKNILCFSDFSISLMAILNVVALLFHSKTIRDSGFAALQGKVPHKKKSKIL